MYPKKLISTRENFYSEHHHHHQSFFSGMLLWGAAKPYRKFFLCLSQRHWVYCTLSPSITSIYFPCISLRYWIWGRPEGQTMQSRQSQAAHKSFKAMRILRPELDTRRWSNDNNYYSGHQKLSSKVLLM